MWMDAAMMETFLAPICASAGRTIPIEKRDRSRGSWPDLRACREPATTNPATTTRCGIVRESWIQARRKEPHAVRADAAPRACRRLCLTKG
jgi:hypothetical protein